MKARVKATGEIGIVSQIDILLNDDFISFSPNRIEILQAYADASPKEEPDYWTRLEHQYAGMAMQGIVSSYAAMREISKESNIPQYVANMAFGLAHALVEKYKKEERK